MFTSSQAKEQIRQRLDIAEVVSEVVVLKPAGRGRLKGLCPFHSEKTPSFHVMQDRGFYYCFGCQAKGDIFNFVMQTQGLDFAEALQQLGRQAGVEVEAMTPKESRGRDLYAVNGLARDFFREQLTKGPALAYLEQRKLSPESIATFELGFAPDSWDSLLSYALERAVKEQDLLDAGLIKSSDRGRRYDNFRNRVMFPIKDAIGRVVGFSGRVLDDSLPKYMNTAETDVFKKSEILYGLDLARPAIRASAEVIVVEGYMDVIALHQVGIFNVVAALGATMTAEQAEHLSRLDVQQLFLAFDADAAGQRAILSGLEQSVGRQFLVKAVELPQGKDPAEAVLDGDVEVFKAALKQGISETAFRFSSVTEKYDRHTTEGKKAILEELLSVLKPRDVFDPVSAEMRRLIIDHLKIDGRRLDEWVQSKRKRKLNATQVTGMQQNRYTPSQRAVVELEVMALLLLEPDKLADRLALILASLPNELNDSLLVEFAEICRDCSFDDQQILSKYREREEGKVVFERLFSQGDDEESRIDVERNIMTSLARLREFYIDGAKELQRQQLLARMQEVSQYLTDPTLPTDKLQHYYAELKEINESLKARDAERRMRMPSKRIKGRR